MSNEPKLEALRYNGDKPRLSLLPSQPLIEIAKVMTVGAKKYATDNWRNGFEYRSIYDSLQRHLLAWLEGEDLDKETGLSHLAHAGCNILFLLEQVIHRTGKDDRFNVHKAYEDGGKHPWLGKTEKEYWDEVKRITEELNGLTEKENDGTDSKD